MFTKYKDRQAKQQKQRMQKQITFPEMNERLTPPFRRAVTLPAGRTVNQQGLPSTGKPSVDSPLSIQIRRARLLQKSNTLLSPASAMSETSGKEDESDTETDTGNNDLQDDAAAPETPQTSDVLSDDKINPYQFRVDDLKDFERRWVEDKIKTFDVDVPDDPGVAAPPATSRQTSSGPQMTYNNQASTTAFGKLHFEGEDSIGVLPSWFIRLAVNTATEHIEELLESKLEVTSNKSYPIRIHCIDYNRWPEDDNLPRYSSNSSSSSNRYYEAVITKLQKDLYSMCKKTAGVVLTWSGQGGDNIIHQVLCGIMEESRKKKRNIFNLACIATPPWNAVTSDVRQKMQKAKGKNIHIKREEDEDAFLPDSRASLGPEISQYATHFLLLDDSSCQSDQILETDTERSNFRHFHYHVIDAMESSERRKTVEMPVVCILINGHHDALKMVWFALQNHIPVLVVKGSGGYADVIADVYLNADPETIKDRDKTGQVRTRITKKAGDRGKFYMNNPQTRHPLLQKIFNSLDLLTVYVPALSVQTLDSVVFEALLKNKQERKFDGLVKIMKRSKKMQQPEISFTEKKSFIDSDEVQMDYFIEALKQNCVNVVKTFLDELDISKKFMEHFHLGRVLRLYSQNADVSERLIDSRRRFAGLLHKLTVLPLRCVCDGCPSCDVNSNTQSPVSELAVQRTCLHPTQELFLWSLLDRHVDMAVVFWQRCEDKIAAALVARKVFRSMAKENSDPDVRWQMDENVRQFQDLAIQTLRNCHNMDEIQTELLLTKPCPWWGNISVLQLGIMTENREFMTQAACKSIMTRIWMGLPPSDPDSPKRSTQLLADPSDTKCSGRLQWCSPFRQYIINFFMQGVFLLLFSIELLFDLDHDLGNGMTYIFIFLIVWVFAITLEEIRQLVSKPSVLRDSNLKRSCTTRTKVQIYFSQYWNVLDVITIILFWLGMVVFAPIPAVHEVGRFLLAIDIFFFYMRTFQMLMVFDDLGLLLVMVFKMMEDTKNFMIILLIFVLAYAVTSESLLYPQSEFTWSRVFHLPRKAYWQVFGELSLEEIEIREEGSCAVNTSKHLGYDEPHCPTESGSYIVPILLGCHVMVTNVLLLNLLIARFGVTFAKVHDEACEYQSWHRCQIITEYYNRTSFPPPFNILYIACYLLAKCCLMIKKCICRFCCCCRRTVRHGRNTGNAHEMTQRGQGAQNGQDNNPRSSVSGEQNPLLVQGSLKAWRSADKQSVDIVWTNELPVSNQGQGSEQNWTDQVYQVEVTVISDQQTQPKTEKYQVARKAVKQAFTVWDLEPNTEYKIVVEGVQVNPEQGESLDPEDILEMVQFEDRQAKWASYHQDSNMTWLKDLQAQTDTLKMEISKMAGELKENHGALKEDISKSSEKMNQNAKSLQKMKDYSQKSKGVFKKIDDNLVKLNEFLSNIAQTVQDEGRKRKEAEERKKNAEKELQDLTKSLAKQQKEVQQSMEVLKKDVTTVLQRHEGLQQEQQKVMQQHLQDLEEKHQAHLQQEQHQIHMQQQLQDLQEQHRIHMQQQLQDLHEQHQIHMQQVVEQLKQVIKDGQEASEADVGSGQ